MLFCNSNTITILLKSVTSVDLCITIAEKHNTIIIKKLKSAIVIEKCNTTVDLIKILNPFEH